MFRERWRSWLGQGLTGVKRRVVIRALSSCGPLLQTLRPHSTLTGGFSPFTLPASHLGGQQSAALWSLLACVLLEHLVLPRRGKHLALDLPERGLSYTNLILQMNQLRPRGEDALLEGWTPGGPDSKLEGPAYHLPSNWWGQDKAAVAVNR